MFWWLAAVLLTCLLILWQFTSKHDRAISEFHRLFPRPPTLPIIGNLHQLKSPKDFLHVLHDFRKTYGKTYSMQLGPTTQELIVSEHKLLESIFTSTKLITKSPLGYDFLRPWLGNGLLTSSGSQWRKRRKLLTPAFHFKILEQNLEVFDSAGSTLIEKIRSRGDATFDVHPFVSMCSLDIVCESSMGTKVNAQLDENSNYIRNVKMMCSIMVQRSLSVIKRFDLLYPLTSSYYVQRRILPQLHAHTNAVIEARRTLRAATQTEDVSAAPRKKRQAFLDILLDANCLRTEDIREEVDTFMFEGHDTTSSGISFTLYCLSTHKDVQEQVFAEQTEIFGDERDPKVEYNHLQSMNYLDKVIKEVLRLYPSVPHIGRVAVEPVEIDGMTIPAGAEFLLNLFSVMRDPDYFPEPDKFIPERFESYAGINPFVYVPFSAGQRNCIGQKFAMLEMKAVISKIVRHFELLPAHPAYQMHLIAETILKSHNGIKMRFRKRN